MNLKSSARGFFSVLYMAGVSADVCRMSIEIDNPQTTLSKADAAANLIEQMYLAHMVKDENKFKEAHKKASSLMFDVVRELEEKEH